jgi:hypothetical protein
MPVLRLAAEYARFDEFANEEEGFVSLLIFDDSIGLFDFVEEAELGVRLVAFQIELFHL